MVAYSRIARIGGGRTAGLPRTDKPLIAVLEARDLSAKSHVISKQVEPVYIVHILLYTD